MTPSDLICAGCGYRMTAAECLEEPEAVPLCGDLSACLNCGMLYVYHAYGWSPLSQDERRALPPEIQAQLFRIEHARHASITRDLAFEQELQITELEQQACDDQKPSNPVPPSLQLGTS